MYSSSHKNINHMPLKPNKYGGHEMSNNHLSRNLEKELYNTAQASGVNVAELTNVLLAMALKEPVRVQQAVEFIKSWKE